MYGRRGQAFITTYELCVYVSMRKWLPRGDRSTKKPGPTCTALELLVIKQYDADAAIHILYLMWNLVPAVRISF
jgi:hypothetical protein